MSMIKSVVMEGLEIISLFYNVNKLNIKQGEKVQFGREKDQYYIIKKPKQILSKTLAVYIHGGGFRFSSAKQHNFIGDWYCEQGFISVNLCYRKVPKFRYPTQIEDVFEGLKNAIEKLKFEGIEINNIVVTGGSAGGYLGSLLCFDQVRQKQYGLDHYSYKGFCSLSGVLNVNFSNNHWIYKNLMGNFFCGKIENPLTYIQKEHATNLLVMYSIQDPIVNKEDTKKFFEEYQGKKSLVEVQDKLHTKVCVSPFLYKDHDEKIYLDWLNQWK